MEEKMKRNMLMVTMALVLVALAAVACAPAQVVYPGAAANSASAGGIIVSQQNLGLWVSGNGKASATPDIVILSLGVESEQPTVAAAQKDAVDAMNKVIQVLKSSGIADKDIQTRQYNIQQVTRWEDNSSKLIIIGYRVSNMVDAKLRDISRAGAIIDNVASAGGDLIRINGISFSVDDPAPYYKIAREKAVQAAMDKARQLSQTSGVKLGKVIYMDEGSYNIPVMRNTYMLKSAEGYDAGSSPTPISGGELEFQATVQIVYEIN